MVLNQIMPIINMKKAAQAAFSLAPPSSLYSSTLEFIFTESELSVDFLSLVAVRFHLTPPGRAHLGFLCASHEG